MCARVFVWIIKAATISSTKCFKTEIKVEGRSLLLLRSSVFVCACVWKSGQENGSESDRLPGNTHSVSVER